MKFFAYVRIKTKSILELVHCREWLKQQQLYFTLYIANVNELYRLIGGWAGVIACTILTISIYIFWQSVCKELSNIRTRYINWTKPSDVIHQSNYDNNQQGRQSLYF